MKTPYGILAATALLMTACASQVPLSSPSLSAASGASSAQTPAPLTSLSFVDLPQFDRQLSQSLNADLPQVDVVFYEKVSPNQVPERLQRWLSAVERTGGKVRVNPPPNDITPKDPFFLLSLLGSLVSSIKGIAEVQSDLPLVSAQGRDVVISLERNARGEVIIGKMAFVRP